MDDTILDARNLLKNTDEARALMQEVRLLLKESATSLHTSASLQKRIYSGIQKYLSQLETTRKFEAAQETLYTTMASRLGDAVTTNATPQDLTTIITADMEGAKLSATSLLALLNTYEQKRESLLPNAEAAFRLILNAESSLLIVETNYQVAMAKGGLSLEAVNSKVSQLKTKVIAQTTLSLATIGALTYYSTQLSQQMKQSRGGIFSGNFDGAGKLAALQSSQVLIAKLTENTKKSQVELEEMKKFSEEAEKAVREMDASGSVLRQNSDAILNQLISLKSTVAQALETRAQTDIEMAKFVEAQNRQAKADIDSGKITVYAE